MKTKIVCFLSILIFAGGSYSQNWKLLVENKTYFYKHIDSLYITNTIKIDSTNNSATDSIFNIHTTIKICDTCTNIPTEAVGGVLYHVHYPEIFGHTPSYSVSNNSYNFDDNIIQQNSELSDSWIFNSISGITATIVDTDEINILGNLDSIKIIALSTLDTIIISKNYGVIRYPDFDNAGKYFSLTGYHEGQNSFGEYLPNARRIYDFGIGDIFCYKIAHYNGGTFEQVHLELKIKILENQSDQDTIAYKAKLIALGTSSYWGPEPPFPVEYSSTGYIGEFILNEIDDQNTAENNYAGAYTPPAFIDDYEMEHQHLLYSEFNNSFLTAPYLLGCDGVIIIDFQWSNYFGYIKNIRPYKLYGDSLCYRTSESSYIYYLSTEGIGKLDSRYSCFEGETTNELVGFVVDGDTVGTIYNYPDDLSLGESQTTKLKIYPNPTNSQITIPSNLQMISIYSIAGDLVLRLENPNQQIYVGDLPAGIYFVHGFDLEGNQMETKLVISH